MAWERQVVPQFAESTLTRLAGVALVLGALVATLVIGAVHGRAIRGSAVAEPVAEPPRPGDCVTENLHDRGTPDEIYFWEGGGPTVDIESCDGVRYGEVAHVFTVAPHGEIGRESRDRTYSACDEPVSRYLGLPPREIGPSMQPFTDPLVAVVGPTNRQRAAGQTWAACVVYPDPTPGRAPTVDHSLRNAWQRPADRWLAAACADDLVNGRGTSCGLPHRYEAFSWVRGSPGATQESLESLCQDATAQALGSPAPFDRGELESMAVAVNDKVVGPLTGPQVIDANGDFDVFCVVTPADGARMLTAPIRGLGDAPIPLS